MSQNSAEILKRLLLENGLESIISPPEYEEKLINSRIAQLEQVTNEYRKLIPGDDNVSFAPEALADEAVKNPHKVRAFLQTLASPSRSFQMQVMAWRILQGLRIHHVEMKYEEEKEFSLKVILVRRINGQDVPDAEYTSDDIWDASLLKHFGACKVSGDMARSPNPADKPLFLGFNPLRLREDG